MKVLMDQSDKKTYSDFPHNYPAWMVEENRKQIENNHGQTVERLNERGGLCPIEMMCAVSGMGLFTKKHLTMRQAIYYLLIHIEMAKEMEDGKN